MTRNSPEKGKTKKHTGRFSEAPKTSPELPSQYSQNGQSRLIDEIWELTIFLDDCFEIALAFKFDLFAPEGF